MHPVMKNENCFALLLSTKWKQRGLWRSMNTQKIPKTGSLGKVVPQLQEELGYHTGRAAEKKGESKCLVQKT